jgi:hypothetical protein
MSAIRTTGTTTFAKKKNDDEMEKQHPSVCDGSWWPHHGRLRVTEMK